MKNKTVEVNGITCNYKSLADAYADRGDYISALGFLFRSLKEDYCRETLSDIANLYADMELFDLSNVYLFKVLERSKKEEVSSVYQDLASNFFYLNDYFHSGYYLHKKVQLDGYIAEEGVDREIVDFFQKESDENKRIRVVYPPEKADFSVELKTGKLALASGDFKGAITQFSKVSKGSKEYVEAMTELCVAYFMHGDMDTAMTLSKELVRENQDNVIILCNHAGMLFAKNDVDKSLYYYEKALALQPQNLEEYYKLATCSLEHKRADIGVKFLQKVIDDRPYEPTLLQLKGLGLINSGDYQGAKQTFLDMYKIDPENAITKYYARLSQRLIDGEQKAFEMLPLVYTSALPQKEIAKQNAYINRLLKQDKQKVRNTLKSDIARDYIDRVFWSGNNDLIKKCVYLLIVTETDWGTDYMLEKLKGNVLPEHIKEFAVYLFILSGRKARTTVVMDGFMAKFKPQKFNFEKSPDGSLFFDAYALAYSKLIFKEDDDGKKLGQVCQHLYDNFSSILSEYKNGEIASYLFYVVTKGDPIKLKQICKIFKVEEERIKEIMGLVGDKPQPRKIKKKRKSND